VTLKERLRNAIDKNAILVLEESSVTAIVAITKVVNIEVDSYFPNS
jgi:hypothetical protein